MREFIDVTGKTEEDAVQKALEQLHMDRDDVSVEILERAKSGFLGLGSCPAKVRVSYGEEETEREVIKTAPAPRPERPKTAQPEPVSRSVKPEQRPAKREAAERKEPVAKKTAPDKREVPVRKEPSVRKEGPEECFAAPGEEINDEKAQQIKEFLSGLLRQMESVAEVKVYQSEKGRYKVILEGQNLGALIGRRGETLDAIQQLTSYSINRTGGRVRVQLDAENYRAKREQSLEHLAKKVAAKVGKYHRSVTLEPMNAYERHVIHTALQDEPGITTYSTGVDPNRRVIVAYDREKA